jgi:hypothetical protein
MRAGRLLHAGANRIPAPRIAAWARISGLGTFARPVGCGASSPGGQMETTEAQLPAEVLGKLDIGGDVEAMRNEDGVSRRRGYIVWS